MRGGLLFLLLATPLYAQTGTTPAPSPRVTAYLENLTRLESWSFFPPLPLGGDPEYTLLGNRATLGVRVDGRRFAIEGSVRYAQLVGLPPRAVGPGPLGPGALYRGAARTPAAYQLYFKSMSLRVNNAVPNLSIAVGRMRHQSDDETPFAGRLIGAAEWTTFERAFDGVRVDYERTEWRAHAAFVMPTQGAFEESANPTMEKVQVATASWTRRPVHLFAHHYRDTRAVSSRPDNTGRAVAAIDVAIRTIGGSLLAGPRGDQPGMHFHAWGALQRGSWYDQEHRASSGVIEGGYRWSAGWRPQLTAGLSYASGDDDVADGAHGTFFAMLPTTTPDALGGTYAQMNLRDVYGRVLLQPAAHIIVSGEVHRLTLATARDRWYSGTGATARSGDYFGFSTRASRLATSLGVYSAAAVQLNLSPRWSLSTTAGVIRGGEVVRRQFAGVWSRVLMLQSRLTL